MDDGNADDVVANALIDTTVSVVSDQGVASGVDDDSSSTNRSFTESIVRVFHPGLREDTGTLCLPYS